MTPELRNKLRMLTQEIQHEHLIYQLPDLSFSRVVEGYKYSIPGPTVYFPEFKMGISSLHSHIIDTGFSPGDLDYFMSLESHKSMEVVTPTKYWKAEKPVYFKRNPKWMYVLDLIPPLTAEQADEALEDASLLYTVCFERNMVLPRICEELGLILTEIQE